MMFNLLQVLSGATAVLQADILEIDTKNREVSFNGEVEGARGRIDVLADFIELAPALTPLSFQTLALQKVRLRSACITGLDGLDNEETTGGQ